jgi:hypothetical protein
VQVAVVDGLGGANGSYPNRRTHPTASEQAFIFSTIDDQIVLTANLVPLIG